ncbi:hypothetical protein TCAL_16980 [Tigriopus californicus]|uniref:Uncharacterized protein n=1 Tax=Tigriopus californicus TaxID=6832 RepID=A0A553PIF5_TIGCA|nr:hypothetical protein TCAL_16980 [Tigriopus californicus]
MGDRSVEYDLVARRRIAMNADPVPCHEIEPYPLFHECLDDYVERTIGCALPWRNGSNPKFAICQTSGQFLEYWTMVDHLIDWGESYLYQITGCYTKCRRHYLKVSKHNTIKAGNDGKNAVSFITFVYKEPELSIETENLAYDSLDLIGDIGGYLGLLLGVSILTVWDLCHNLGLVLVKKKNNTTWTI